MKMPCLSPTQENLITVHHEMGHIQYYLSYLRQPFVYRLGANQGFQESVGDAIALSITTPKYLHDLGLIDQLHEDKGKLPCSLTKMIKITESIKIILKADEEKRQSRRNGER